MAPYFKGLQNRLPAAVRFVSLALFFLALSSFASQVALANAPTFPTLSQGDFDRVIKEFSANSTLHTVTPPSSMGSIFGFEVGLVGGAVSTPEIDKLVQQASPGSDVKMLPHASLLGVVSIPFGLTGELAFVPSQSLSGLTYSNYAAALKYSSSLPFLPINVGVRGFLAKTEVSFSQTINNSSTGNVPVEAKVTYEGQVTGLQLLVSPMLIPIIEPYAGFGLLSASGKMGVSGTANATLFSFTSAQAAESNPTSAQIFLGIDVRLLLIGMGIEYSRAFDTETYTGKLSLKF